MNILDRIILKTISRLALKKGITFKAEKLYWRLFSIFILKAPDIYFRRSALSAKYLHLKIKILALLRMFGMMAIHSLGFLELGIAGFLLGAASGFFWTNRYLLTLYNTKDDNRNYFFGLESFFFSIASIGIPLIIGAFISRINGKEVLGMVFDINRSYQVITMVVAFITIIA